MNINLHQKTRARKI